MGGIGLSLVKEFVRLDGGHVEAHSAGGKGSEFVVRLPLADGPSGIASPRPTTVPG
jgi:signal transduction histidine kinase